MVVPLTRPAPPSQPIIFTSGFKTVKMALDKSETGGFKTGVQKPMGDVTKAPPTSIYSLWFNHRGGAGRVSDIIFTVPGRVADAT